MYRIEVAFAEPLTKLVLDWIKSATVTPSLTYCLLVSHKERSSLRWLCWRGGHKILGLNYVSRASSGHIVLFLQRLITTNVHRPWIFFFSVETWVFMDFNQPFLWFSHMLWQRGFLRHWIKGEDLPEKFRMTTVFLILFISLRWRITLLKQQSLFELREIAEIRSIVDNVKVFRLFIYLNGWICGSRGVIAKERKFKEMKISHWQGTKVSSEQRLFSNMNFVTCGSTYHSPCYWTESWTSLAFRGVNCKHVLRKLLCGCNVQCLLSRQFEFPLTNTQQTRTPCNLDMKWCQILSQNIAKTA